MTTEVVWSEAARQDLLDIYITIAIDNPRAAERF